MCVCATVRVSVCSTSDRPSHCTWAWIHSRRSEFSFSRTPSLTCEQSSSAFSSAARRWLWSGWDSGVFSKIYGGRTHRQDVSGGGAGTLLYLSLSKC